MRKLTYYVALSLDGYIAGPRDEVDFYPLADDHIAHMNAEYPEVLPSHVRALTGGADAPNRHFDTVVMGRRTYEPALREGITNPYAHLRTYVCSSTLTESPDPAVTVTAEDPVALVRRLKAEDGPLGVYLAGGGRLAGALLPEIDRLILKKYPVVAGAGIPAFATGFDPARFTLTDSRTFSNGCTVLTLDRA